MKASWLHTDPSIGDDRPLAIGPARAAPSRAGQVRGGSSGGGQCRLGQTIACPSGKRCASTDAGRLVGKNKDQAG
jgi:hypothetical protein